MMSRFFVRISIVRLFFTRISPIVTSCFVLLGTPCLQPAQTAGLLPGYVGAKSQTGNGNGAGYAVRFEGNEKVSEKELREAAATELAKLAAEGFAKTIIDDAAFMMESHYRDQGYTNARVDYRLEEEAAPVQVVFVVFEGKRVLVSGLAIVGNTFFEIGELLKTYPDIAENVRVGQPFPLVEEQLKGLVSDMYARYLAEGYLDSSVDPPQISLDENKTTAKVIYSVSEGIRYRIGQIEFSGQPAKMENDLADLRQSLQGQIYFQRRRLFLKSRVFEICEDDGYPSAEIEVSFTKKAEQGLVDLQVKVVPGPKVLVGEIHIKGQERTRESFIADRLVLVPGKPYSLSDRRTSFRKLYATGLFSSVSISLAAGAGNGEKESSRDVIVEVKERKAREIYFEPGWGSYELLRLAVGYKDRNLFGTGRIFRIDSSFSVKGRNLEFGFTDRWFLATSIQADFPVNYRYRQEPVFTQEETGIGALFTKQFPKHISLSAGYRLSRNNITEVEPDIDRSVIDTSYRSSVISLQLVRDSRNDIFFPSKGYRAIVAGELSVPQLGGDLSYYRLTTGVRYFLPLPHEIILGLRYATGIVLPYGNQVGIPLGERFFNGGENSVRSFRESRLGPVDSNGDAVGGTAYNVIVVELRKKLLHNFAGSLFVDLGNISPNRSLENSSTPLAAERSELTSATFRDYFRDMRAGIGCGLQYLLPVGPARLDLAVNPNPDSERDENDYAIHFSIGMAF